MRLPKTDLFIGGEWVPPSTGKTFDVVNPATEQVVAKVASGGRADVDRAVAAARKAFDEGAWPKMAAKDRAKLVWKLGELLLKYNEGDVAVLETAHNGKPIFESQYVDIPHSAECLFYFAGWATKIHGETIPTSPDAFTYTLREPIGVVGAITPWNFPLMLGIWKVAPALAAGNTIVWKPASLTPLTALRFAEIAQEAGLPPGVLNVVTGPGAEAGGAMVAHPGIDKIAFTGETRTGIQLMKDAADSLKRVTLELGGKSPNIVLADCDLEAAVRGATNGIFYGKGEVCAAGSRLFVEEKIHDEFMAKLVDRVNKLVPADPMHPKTRMGALVSRKQMETVLSYVDAGKKEGARLVAGGERADVGGKGYFVKPTVFDGVRNDMRIAREEIFGPVLATIPVKDVEEAAAKANETVYGLAAAVWTRDVRKAHQVARRLKAGTVWVNAYNLYDNALPFGGYKQSGFGRECGSAAVEHYTQTKSVWVSLA